MPCMAQQVTKRAVLVRLCTPTTHTQNHAQCEAHVEEAHLGRPIKLARDEKQFRRWRCTPGMDSGRLV